MAVTSSVGENVSAGFITLADLELPLLEVEAPARPALIATVRVSSDTPPAAAPPGWRHCSPRRLALTRSAAEVDLRQGYLGNGIALGTTRDSLDVQRVVRLQFTS